MPKPQTQIAHRGWTAYYPGHFHLVVLNHDDTVHPHRSWINPFDRPRKIRVDGRHGSRIASDQPIEAGEVGELKDLPFHEARHRAETARSLAMWLPVISSLLSAAAIYYFTRDKK
jgi:hypothetical protein